MGFAIDITGQRYGRLVAIANTGKRQLRNFIWTFKCDCGEVVERPSGEVRRGKTLSCGCMRSEMKAEQMREHAGDYNVKRAIHGKTGTPEWISWSSMRQRCLDKNSKDFQNYGGRGISICERWLNSFVNFLEDMGPRPDGTSLERKNVNGNYEPGNCKWATSSDQGNNRRNNRVLEFNGRTMTAKQWSDELGLCDKTVLFRLKSGWSIEDALTRPTKGELKLLD